MASYKDPSISLDGHGLSCVGVCLGLIVNCESLVFLDWLRRPQFRISGHGALDKAEFKRKGVRQACASWVKAQGVQHYDPSVLHSPIHVHMHAMYLCHLCT